MRMRVPCLPHSVECMRACMQLELPLTPGDLPHLRTHPAVRGGVLPTHADMDGTLTVPVIDFVMMR